MPSTESARTRPAPRMVAIMSARRGRRPARSRMVWRIARQAQKRIWAATMTAANPAPSSRICSASLRRTPVSCSSTVVSAIDGTYPFGGRASVGVAFRPGLVRFLGVTGASYPIRCTTVMHRWARVSRPPMRWLAQVALGQGVLGRVVIAPHQGLDADIDTGQPGGRGEKDGAVLICAGLDMPVSERVDGRGELLVLFFVGALGGHGVQGGPASGAVRGELTAQSGARDAGADVGRDLAGHGAADVASDFAGGLHQAGQVGIDGHGCSPSGWLAWHRHL